MVLAFAVLMLAGMVAPGAYAAECDAEWECLHGACHGVCASCPCCQAEMAVPLLARIELNPDSTPVLPAQEEAPRPAEPRALLHVPRSA